ncbi:Catalase [Operophtera brumata]|uniref:Catalase n=1 Tax=Operophtera brumata TaxID=104452 RepID=A0A0L7L5S1_OPEBR|nr:Catalase [Operophtera brumata]
MYIGQNGDRFVVCIENTIQEIPGPASLWETPDHDHRLGLEIMKVLVLILMLKMVISKKEELAPAAQQIVNFKQKTKGPIGVMKTSGGAPIEYHDANNTLDKPLYLNEYYIDSITHFVREKRPERIVHAKAAGAFGYFKVTHDISDICKASLFSAVGKKTPVAARFSLANTETDTSRDARGFAIKFYTEEGNFDIAGLNFPMFAFKDPLLFTTFARTQTRNPATNLIDGNMMWDFLTLNPESFYIFLLIFGSRGIPDGYRHMPGYSIHTYELVNKFGGKSFARFHFIPDAGIKNLLTEQAMEINGVDPDYATRDLYNAIGRGDFPGWTLKIQVLSLEDVKCAGFDVFDVTKVLPLDKYPLRPVGKLCLDRNPVNYIAQIGQLAYSPANLVPGIHGAPDKVFEARRLAYRDAQYYRLGANFNKIPVNCPMHSKPMTYNRNGRPPVDDNGRDIPNYYPNSFNGPAPYIDSKRTELIKIYQDKPNNFEQATELYTNGMTKEERCRLVKNVLYSLASAIQELQDKAVKIFSMIHPDLGRRIQQETLEERPEILEKDEVAFFQEKPLEAEGEVKREVHEQFDDSLASGVLEDMTKIIAKINPKNKRSNTRCTNDNNNKESTSKTTEEIPDTTTSDYEITSGGYSGEITTEISSDINEITTRGYVDLNNIIAQIKPRDNRNGINNKVTTKVTSLLNRYKSKIETKKDGKEDTVKGQKRSIRNYGDSYIGSTDWSELYLSPSEVEDQALKIEQAIEDHNKKKER